MVGSAPRPRDWEADPMLPLYVEILHRLGSRYLEAAGPLKDTFPPPGRRTSPESLGLGLVLRWAGSKLPAEQVADWIDRYQRGGSPDEQLAECACVICEVLLELGETWFHEQRDNLLRHFGAPFNAELPAGVEPADFNQRMASVLLLVAWAMDLEEFPPDVLASWLDSATHLAATPGPVVLVPAERWEELQVIPRRLEEALRSLEGRLPVYVLRELRETLLGEAPQVPLEVVLLALPPDQRQLAQEALGMVAIEEGGQS